MASIFEALDEIRKRPGLYLGADESQRAVQLQNLEQWMNGYAAALRHHGLHEVVSDFPREFGEYLWRVKRWSASCGPVSAIRDASTSDDEAWELFWRLVDEFRGAQGER